MQFHLSRAARRFAREGGSTVRETTSSMGDRLGDMTDSAQKMAAHYYNQGRHSLRHSAENVEHYVEEHPVRSALVALGVGCLLCAMLIRR